MIEIQQLCLKGDPISKRVCIKSRNHLKISTTVTDTKQARIGKSWRVDSAKNVKVYHLLLFMSRVSMALICVVIVVVRVFVYRKPGGRRRRRREESGYLFSLLKCVYVFFFFSFRNNNLIVKREKRLKWGSKERGCFGVFKVFQICGQWFHPLMSCPSEGYGNEEIILYTRTP